MAPLAGLERLSYWYPGAAGPALDAAGLDLEEGLTLVTGPSGGGKSTLLRVLNGLVPHFHGGRVSGRATVLGLDVLRTPTRDMARRVGFVFQDPESQFVYGTVEREVAFGLENLGVPAHEMGARVEEALAAVAALSLRSRAVRSLSGGEKQRVALASVLAMRPKLVVLDEPTSQLDTEGAALLLAACLELRARGTSVVVAEHRVEALSPAASCRIAVDAGRVVPAPPEGLLAVSGPLSTPGSEVAWSVRGLCAGPAGTPVLWDVDLSGRAGEILVLTGPNGGGKTTLLRTLAGLIPPLAGAVERRPGPTAYQPQDPSALHHMPTLRDEVAQTLAWTGQRDTGLSILDELGLASLAGRYPRDLSTGERQRAAIAAALAGRPMLALLDEPTRGMDAAARQALVALVRRLALGGASVVLATHDARLAGEVGHRVLRVANGQARPMPAEAVS